MNISDYSLIDCGAERRLERFGQVLVSRPAPAARFPATLPASRWNEATLSFARETGWSGSAPDDWRVSLDGVALRLRPAAAGQLGVFPEHAAVASRLVSLVPADAPAGGWRVLNLFAHTGLVTLRLAARAAVSAVAHVDASPASVRQARENAAASGLADRPVRWLVDDAMAFVSKEVRRGNRYDMIVADPPAFGRSKRGGEWKLERDLPGLLAAARMLLAGRGVLCLTCHGERWNARALSDMVGECLPEHGAREAMDLALVPESGGRALPAGCAVFAAIGCGLFE